MGYYSMTAKEWEQQALDSAEAAREAMAENARLHTAIHETLAILRSGAENWQKPGSIWDAVEELRTSSDFAIARLERALEDKS